MRLTERHCMLCESEGREQAGGVFIVACKQYDCCNTIADEAEADAYVAQLEAENERLRGESKEKHYTLKEIKDIFLPNRELASLRSQSEQSEQYELLRPDK